MKAALVHGIARVAAGAFWVMGGGAFVPSVAQSAKGYNAERTPSGEPDLRGIWEVRGTINWNIEGHPAQGGIAASKSVIVDPADGKIPSRPEARAKKSAMNLADDPQTKCYMAGVPRITYTPGPFQIFQTDGMVVAVYQDLHTYRFIPTTPRPQMNGADFWMGSSRGHWEGNTLVVDSVSFNDQTWFDKAGNFHSEDLHVVERFTLTGRNTMQYEALIEDPKVFTKPWKMRMIAERHIEPGFRILEDECLKDSKGALYHTALPKASKRLFFVDGVDAGLGALLIREDPVRLIRRHSPDTDGSDHFAVDEDRKASRGRISVQQDEHGFASGIRRPGWRLGEVCDVFRRAKQVQRGLGLHPRGFNAYAIGSIDAFHIDCVSVRI